VDLLVSGFASRPLWPDGPPVGPIGLGTAELGMAYGTPGTASARPSARAAAAFLEAALAGGVGFFDTARAYGLAEARLGRALAGRDGIVVASKAIAPPGESGAALRRSLERSVRATLRALRLDAVDVLQVHSAGAAVLARPDLHEALDRLRRQGWIRSAGATVYEEEAARAAIRSGAFQTLQVAVHPLAQGVVPLLGEAEAAGIAVIARSVLLRGALSQRAAALPGGLEPLRDAVVALAEATGTGLADLPTTAYRWALARPAVAVALVGTTDVSELDVALAAAAAGPLPRAAERAIAGLPPVAFGLADPRAWDARAAAAPAGVTAGLGPGA
jgi:aryl-alcohol dehydrogenase-like predicted oxidoreductase